MQRVVLAAVALAFAAGAVGCKPKSTVIRIGQVGPMTGDQAVMGMHQNRGVTLAIEEANGEGPIVPGYTVAIASEDDQHNPTQAVSVAKKFVSDPDVMGVVGHLNSSCTEPAAAIYDKGSLVAITASSTNPAITQHGYKTIFRTCTTDAVQGPLAARYAVKVAGAKKLYLLDDKSTYGAGIAGEFEKELLAQGVEILGHDSITQGEKDFSAILTKVAASKPDLVFFGGMFPECSLLVKQAREKKITAKLMGGDGIFDPALINLSTPAAAEGLLCTYLTPDIEKMESAKAFVEAFKRRFHEPPGDYSANAYDAAKIILAGLKKAGKKDRSAVAAAVRETKDFAGATGVINYDGNGDITNKGVYVYVVRGGKWEYLAAAE